MLTLTTLLFYHPSPDCDGLLDRAVVRLEHGRAIGAGEHLLLAPGSLPSSDKGIPENQGLLYEEVG